MSGYRRHLMAKLAQQDYIEGYAVQVDGAYPATIGARINSVFVDISVDGSTGYWRWSGEITSLRNCFLERNTVSSVKIRTKKSIDMYQFARKCETLLSVDCEGVPATDTYYAFSINVPDYNNGYRNHIQSIVLPIIRNTTANSNYALSQARELTGVTATFIENTMNLINSPLTLQSAINILSALQDVTSYGGKTLTFSATTSALVQADTTAMNLVAQAQANGWTITFN